MSPLSFPRNVCIQDQILPMVIIVGVSGDDCALWVIIQCWLTLFQFEPLGALPGQLFF